MGVGGAFRRAEPRGQGFGFVEGEKRAAAGVGIEQISEPRFDAGALVEERQRTPVGGQDVGQAGAVFLGLSFHADKGVTLGLGFHDSRGPAVHVEQVIGAAVAGL